MDTYGYVRVSTIEQNENRQLIALLEMAVPETKPFVGKLTNQYGQSARTPNPPGKLCYESCITWRPWG